MRIISESEFAARLCEVIAAAETDGVGFVTGPGRSGAIAAVYASHALHIPFIPYGATAPKHLGRALIVDTARESGATLRKAARRYEASRPLVLVAFEEPPRVAFWYEAEKPQHYRHERSAA
jgi:adenine/guanine phosphoribosyltransferase-like PRPP-binding protein